jgi:hypothetical protein
MRMCPILDLFSDQWPELQPSLAYHKPFGKFRSASLGMVAEIAAIPFGGACTNPTAALLPDFNGEKAWKYA